MLIETLTCSQHNLNLHLSSVSVALEGGNQQVIMAFCLYLKAEVPLMSLTFNHYFVD